MDTFLFSSMVRKANWWSWLASKIFYLKFINKQRFDHLVFVKSFKADWWKEILIIGSAILIQPEFRNLEVNIFISPKLDVGLFLLFFYIYI